MKDRDCESCKKFARIDPLESEGYCDAKRTWVDPQEGEDCKMHEFTLHSATKYKDGTPIMSEPEKVYCDTDSALIHGDTNTDTYAVRKAAKNAVYGKTTELSNQLDSLGERIDTSFKNYGIVLINLEQRVNELSEEYDTVLKTHGDTLEEHLERICDLEHMYEKACETCAHINDHRDKLQEHDNKLSTLSEDVSINEGNIESLCCDVEDLQRKVYQIHRFLDSVDPDFFARFQDEMAHKCSNFCGNCTHCNRGKQGDDTVYVCGLSHEIVDPDDSSCSMFEPPF